MEELNQYYKILGLKPGASPEEVKQAYRDLVKIWHPDRFPNDPRLQQKAQERLKEINNAYEQLCSVQAGPRVGATPSERQAKQPERGQAPSERQAEQRMTCPKCGFDQAEAPECRQCGIIITKYKGSSRDHSSPTSATKPINLTTWIGIAFAGLVVLVVIGNLLNKNPDVKQSTPKGALSLAQENLPAIVKRIQPSVVFIQTYDTQGKAFTLDSLILTPMARIWVECGTLLVQRSDERGDHGHIETAYRR